MSGAGAGGGVCGFEGVVGVGGVVTGGGSMVGVDGSLPKIRGTQSVLNGSAE